MRLPRSVVSRATRGILFVNKHTECNHLLSSRSIHMSSTQHLDQESKPRPSLNDIVEIENRHNTETENQPKFSNILDSSDENGQIDFQKLSEFIKNAYKDNETPKPVPTARVEQVEYFQNLFTKYGSFRKLSSSISNNSTNKPGINVVPDEIKNELFTKTKNALGPTLKYLDSFKNSQDLFKYSLKLFKNFQEGITIATMKTQIADKNSKSVRIVNEEIFLNELFKGSNRHAWTESHQSCIDLIEKSSLSGPYDPNLNILTVPIIFTHIITNLGFKFHNGQLALTLFDLLEKDPNLYIIAANQEAFNVALRLVWINYGIINLHPFQTWYSRMKFLGFPGDMTTLNILRIVISEYNNLSNGMLIFNKQSDKIYTTDANWRMKYFRAEYDGMKKRLERRSERTITTKNERSNTTTTESNSTTPPSWGWNSIL